MTLFHVFVLALIQGLTEFLPISSSAHLILPSALLGWPDQGLAFDVAVHVGTLMAVIVYFRKDILLLTKDWCGHCMGKPATSNSKIAWFVIFGTIPAGLAGLLLDDLIETHLRTVLVLALATIVFGLVLGLSDKFSTKRLNLDDMGWKQCVMIGLAQALALIPGTSRSGITISAALALGFDRISAARFSFLLSIPIIALSGGYKGLELVHLNDVPWGLISFAVVISGITAYLCIHSFLLLLSRMGMMIFMWYRLALGGLLLALLASDSISLVYAF